MISVIALGTASGKGITTLTIPNVEAAPGDGIFVSLYSLTGVEVTSITVAGIPMAALSQQEATWWVHLTEIIDGDLVITFGAAETAAAVASRIRQVAAAPFDKTSSANGTGTAPDSGASPATTQNDELLIGLVGTIGPVEDDAGTWGGGFTPGQRVGTTGGAAASNVTVSEAYKVVSATGAYSAAKSGITSRPWYAEIRTMRGIAGSQQRGATLRAGTRRARLEVNQ